MTSLPAPAAPVIGAPMTREVDASTLTPSTGAGGERGFTGTAVPWDTVIDLVGFRERFAPGSIEAAPNVLLCWRHDEPIGRVTGYRDAATGWEVDARFSATTTGRDALALLDDGVVDRLSIRFTPLEWEVTREDGQPDLYTYTRARVDEVSLVPFPAYADAGVSAVRSATSSNPNPTPVPVPVPTPDPVPNPQEGAPMPDTLAPESTELRAGLDELTRRVDMLDAATPGTRAADAHPLAQFRSFGEYVKAVASGDDAALRAYAGTVLADVTPAEGAPAWASNVVHMVDALTPTVNTFTHTKDLPATGMSVEYGQVILDNGLRVAEQLAEGDDLVFGKITLSADGRAKVHTLGGWTDMSRQVIERSAVNVVDVMWRAFAIRYAEALEALARAAMTDLYNARVAVGTTATLAADLTTADGVIDFLVDMATRYETSPFKLDAIYLGPDAFRTLAKIPETPKALQITSAPTDKLGTVNVSALEANLSNITVKLWSTAPTPTAAFATDAQAIKVQESPGAPFRLQDENIINLTKQFSVYGYAAVYSEMPEALVPIVAKA